MISAFVPVTESTDLYLQYKSQKNTLSYRHTVSKIYSLPRKAFSQVFLVW